jgi:NADPH-dependent 7-cyano-7-deazaguanine reductase QueF-like protein
MSHLYFESFLQEEWDFDAEKRQKMREDLSTAIDDHMSGNNASVHL